MQKKTPEQQAAEAAVKEEEKARVAAQRKVVEQEKQRKAFFESPIGQARAAFERDDVVFQCEVEVASQQSIIAAIIDAVATRKQSTNDPTYLLNQICREGWDLVTGSFVFIGQELESRDQVMSSGQTAEIRGKTVGYYLFKRCPENRREVLHSGETDAES